MIKLDMHVHTITSKDSTNRYEKIVQTCKEKGINGLVISDHNSIDGAHKMQEITKDIKIIVGEEIKTKQGEIIGLFLNKKVEPYQDVRDTALQIKEQGGLIYVPHPFDRIRKSRISFDGLKQIIDLVDILEVFNSRNIFSSDDEKALEFAKKEEKLMGVGSDAHTYNEIGTCSLEIEDFETKEDFLRVMKDAKLNKKRSSMFVHVITKFVKLSKK